MTYPKQYAIYYVNLDPTVGSELRKVRPAVVVSRNRMNRALKTVVVCPLTTSLHPLWRSRILIRCAGRDAEIAVDQIRAVDKRRVGDQIDRLPDARAARLRRLITEMYGE